MSGIPIFIPNGAPVLMRECICAPEAARSGSTGLPTSWRIWSVKYPARMKGGRHTTGPISGRRACMDVKRSSLAFVRGEDTYTHTNLPQIPPLNGQLSLTGRIAGLGAVTASTLWCGPQNNTGIDEPRTPGHAVLNLGFSGLPWQIGGAAITVRTEVRNCFDKAYRNHLTTLRGMLKDEPGRNVMISATVSF